MANRIVDIKNTLYGITRGNKPMKRAWPARYPAIVN